MSKPEEPESVMRPWGQVIELIVVLGLRDLDKLPSPWMHKIDENWTVAVNQRAEFVCCPSGKVVPARAMYFEFQGQPSAMITMDHWLHNNDQKADRDRVALMAALDVALMLQSDKGGQA